MPTSPDSTPPFVGIYPRVRVGIHAPAQQVSHMRDSVMCTLRGMYADDDRLMCSFVLDQVFYCGESLVTFAKRFDGLNGFGRRQLVHTLICQYFKGRRTPKTRRERLWLRKRGLALVIKHGNYTDCDKDTECGALKMLVRCGMDSDLFRVIAGFL